jgi:Domain of unknown function (DUF4278)
MQLTYRGQSFDFQPSRSMPETLIGRYRGQFFHFQPFSSETETIVGKYRGVEFQSESSPELAKQRSQQRLMYRGCAYRFDFQ